MEARGLTVNDEMLLPSSQGALEALLKIVADDLAAIDRGAVSGAKRPKYEAEPARPGLEDLHLLAGS